MCLAVTVSRETPVPVASAFASWEGMSDSIKLGGDPQELSREEQFESCAVIRGPCLCRDPFRYVLSDI